MCDGQKTEGPFDRDRSPGFSDKPDDLSPKPRGALIKDDTKKAEGAVITREKRDCRLERSERERARFSGRERRQKRAGKRA